MNVVLLLGIFLLIYKAQYTTEDLNRGGSKVYFHRLLDRLCTVIKRRGYSSHIDF